jgi:hypothetical protein
MAFATTLPQFIYSWLYLITLVYAIIADLTALF